jgi:hypothetical protein
VSTQQGVEPAADLPAHTDDQPQRTLILVHGGGFKPPEAELRRLWRDALGVGLARDYSKKGGSSLLDDVRLEFVYYGDLANARLQEAGRGIDQALDLEDRLRDLRRLAMVSSKKKFRRVHYEVLPGKTALREFIADMAAPLLTLFGLAGRALERTTPVLAAYLGEDQRFRETCEDRLMQVLAPALARHDDVLLLSHAMGSVISYDVLWRLSQPPLTGGAPEASRVHTWISFGSPLANHYVKRQLRGSGAPVERRFPNKVVNWFNLSAEDDFHCHDKTVADDFALMLRRQQISQIRDYRIYNLAVRYGRSNPHNAVGYLVHPRMTLLLYEWLTTPRSGA